jgi:hypothetical protein
MCLRVRYKKKLWNFFFASLKSLKKGVGSGVGSISQRYGSGDPDPQENQGSPTLPVGMSKEVKNRNKSNRMR